MDPDDAVVRAIIEWLDNRESKDELKIELTKLTNEQLLRVSRILAKRVEMQSGRDLFPRRYSR